MMNGDGMAPGLCLLRPALVATAAGLAAGLAIRYGVIQPPALGWACQGAEPPLWCLPRHALIAALQWGALGWLALAAATLALFGGGRRVTVVAAALGAASLFLYGAGPGALALLLALLRALRLPPVLPAAS